MFTALILAASISYSPAPFDKADYTTLGAEILVSVFDVMNTRSFLGRTICYSITGMSVPYENHPSHPYQKTVYTDFEEGDPILGHHPSALRLWGTFAVTQVVVITTAKLLPNPYRKIFESIAFGVEFSNVTHNIVVNHANGMSWGGSFAIKF